MTAATAATAAPTVPEAPLLSIARRAAVDAAPSADDVDEQLPALRLELVNAQHELKRQPAAVLIQIIGNDRLACDGLIDRLHEWMDARFLHTEVFLAPTEWEAQHPCFWRYWRTLPPHGRIGIFGGGWAFEAITARLSGRLDRAAFERRVEHCRNLETALVRDGMTLLKFWLHAPRTKLRRHLQRAGKASVEALDRIAHDRYDEVLSVADRYIGLTDTAAAPWRVLSTADPHSSEFLVASHLSAVLQQRLDALRRTAAIAAPAAPSTDRVGADGEVGVRARAILAGLDLTAQLERDEYHERLARAQSRLLRWQRRARSAGLTAVLVFEGWDAAGKGGAIRRIIRRLPARDYRIVPIAAPTDEESAHHYLWRFWRALPRAGRMAIFDRSWYGRVLVERVEDLAGPDAWQRAYDEINDFESQLADHGIPVIKFWLHISKEEQLRRFRQRERTPYKEYKITDDDYRNRERWEHYEAAADEMIGRTSTAAAPWHLVAAEDKRWARVQVVETAARELKRAVKAVTPVATPAG